MRVLLLHAVHVNAMRVIDRHECCGRDEESPLDDGIAEDAAAYAAHENARREKRRKQDAAEESEPEFREERRPRPSNAHRAASIRRRQSNDGSASSADSDDDDDDDKDSSSSSDSSSPSSPSSPSSRPASTKKSAERSHSDSDSDEVPLSQRAKNIGATRTSAPFDEPMDVDGDDDEERTRNKNGEAALQYLHRKYVTDNGMNKKGKAEVGCSCCEGSWARSGRSNRRWLTHWVGNSKLNSGAAECKALSGKEMSPADKVMAQKALAALDSKTERRAYRAAMEVDHAAEMETAPRKSRKRNLAPAFEESSKAELDVAFAKMFYATNSKKALIENVHAKAFWRKIGYEPPSRDSIFGPFLDNEFEDLSAKVDAKLNIKAPDVYVTISLDGWSNPRRQAIMNFMLHNGTCTLFHHAVDCTGKTKDAEFTANEITKAIRTIGKTVGDDARAAVICVVTDNAEVMSTAWDRAREANPHVVFIGCSAHSFNLMYSDIMKIDWVATVVAKVKAVCKKFRKIEALNDLVIELSAKPIASGGLDQKLGLLVHGETRFASNSYMLERYVLLLSVLSAIIRLCIQQPRRIGEVGWCCSRPCPALGNQVGVHARLVFQIQHQNLMALCGAWPAWGNSCFI
jgi:hypothetical protein